MSLADVSYQQIDGDYWYGWYMDLRIVINKATGWVNATKFCNDYGKHYYHWTQKKQAKELISAIEQEAADIYGGPTEFRGSTMGSLSTRFNWFVLIKGGKSNTDHLTNGTYIIPDLVPALAMWISSRFFIKACRIVNNYITAYWRDNCELLKKQINDMKTEMELSYKYNDSVANMLEQLTPDIVPKPMSAKLLETYVLMKLNNPLYRFQYASSRCQKRNLRQALDKLKKKHPAATVLLEIGYIANARNLQHRVKEQLAKDDNVKMRRNEFACDNEAKLIGDIKVIATSYL